MKGSETKMLRFMEGADKRYIIPVYQRKYDWKINNCNQLYNDLKKIIRDGRPSHFFGSIVSNLVANGSKVEYHIIDGQQRLTTVTLILLAISNLLKEGLVKSEEEDKLDEQILHRFIIAPWAKKGDKIKLRPVAGDIDALEKLFGAKEDYDKASNLTINYQFFYDQILKEEVTVDELYDAIGKLEIISITLDYGDNAQLIFESLNSTGLALQEGDKIRNYILMGQKPTEQDYLYDNYWTKIETCTENDVSGFVRDYLSIKRLVTPAINNVYQEFKNYAEDTRLPIETLLSDLLRYARLYKKLLACKSGLNNQRLDDCLYRIKRLDIVVIRPFFMEVLRLVQDQKMTTDDALKVFEITENYLFRRNICEVPTNALAKIFLNLNKDIYRYDNTPDRYVDKFIYALLSKKESGRFPDDREFEEALENKAVYQMRGKYKAYLFERLENFGTIEAKDVYRQLDKGVYTIEHIMPQHLTPAWVEALGPNAEEIHTIWLHRLANLTLTGYNPSLSNNPFLEKRDAKKGGYKASGLRMNQKIAQMNSWGLPELKERNAELLEYSKTIWAYPATSFVPAEKEYDTCTLDDENVDLTGRDIIKYSYQNLEQPVTSWADMLERVVKFLHLKDRSILSGLAYSQSNTTDLSSYISTDPKKLRSAIKVDEDIYFEKGSSTSLKMSILRRLFALYGLDPMDLAFYLRDAESDKATDNNRHALRKRYWAYALPKIQEAHSHRGSFANVVPGTSNWCSGYFGIGGFSISCVANYNDAWVALWLSNSDTKRNKKAFDLLYSHKDEIESKIGNYELSWARADEYKASWISYTIKGISILNEEDWPRMAKFHAELSAKMADAMIPYLSEISKAVVLTPEKAEKNKSLYLLSTDAKEWALARSEQGELFFDICNSNRTYTRFRTAFMDELFPDTPGSRSSWNTTNHYFYEIINNSGDGLLVQLVFNSREMPADQVILSDKIDSYYPNIDKDTGWSYRVPFKTPVHIFDNINDKQAVFTQLDKWLNEIDAFETELKSKL